jgi:hypothetical protein
MDTDMDIATGMRGAASGISGLPEAKKEVLGTATSSDWTTLRT